MSWNTFKSNLLPKLESKAFGGSIEEFAIAFVDEYDACLKRGGDLLNGVPVGEGNKKLFVTVLTLLLKKTQKNGGAKIELLDAMGPAVMAYWMGARMAPLPNPTINPSGWPGTIPAPGTISNIMVNPILLAAAIAAKKGIKPKIDFNKKIKTEEYGELTLKEIVEGILTKKYPSTLLSSSEVFDAFVEMQDFKSIKIPSPNLVLNPGTWTKLPLFPNMDSNMFLDTFILCAKIHLFSVGGIFLLFSQYPPPAPPAPSVVNWTGYSVPD